MRGESLLIRYADDVALVFRREEDARRVLDVLPKRFGKYGLTLHPEKTRMVPFQSPARHRAADGTITGTRPGTFDLLGFTHHWALSRRGFWVVKQRTAKAHFVRWRWDVRPPAASTMDRQLGAQVDGPEPTGRTMAEV